MGISLDGQKSSYHTCRSLEDDLLQLIALNSSRDLSLILVHLRFRCPWRNIRLTWSCFDLKETVARANKSCSVVLCQCKIIEKSVCHGWIFCFLPLETRFDSRELVVDSRRNRESRLTRTVNLRLNGTVILTIPNSKAGQWESEAYLCEGCPILTTYYSTIMSFYHIRSREGAKYEAVIHCSVLV